jgi:NAD(P)-dependent dehydrogenase (short-subunit alcohol dehydrogenase family)
MAGKSILIIGASRGIGLGLAQEFAARGWTVFASQRSASEGLEEAAWSGDSRIEIVQADVTDLASIAALGKRIEGGSLDALIVNAGVYGPQDQSLLAIGREDIADILMTNAIGPVQAAAKLLPLLRDRGTVALMTSKMGSIDDSSGGANHYRVSKAAQNMLARSLFENHASKRGIAVLSLHPGWVKTDMGGPNAAITVEQSVRGLANLVEQDRAPEHVFLAYDGEKLPW